MKTETDIQISNLRASLKGEVIGSDDPRYDDVRRVFFTGFDRRRDVGAPCERRRDHRPGRRGGCGARGPVRHHEGDEGPAAALVDELSAGGAETILAHLQTATAAIAAVEVRILGGAIARVADGATAFGHRRAKLMVYIAAMDKHVEKRAEYENRAAWPIRRARHESRLSAACVPRRALIREHAWPRSALRAMIPEV
jgi:hypothetical protein